MRRLTEALKPVRAAANWWVWLWGAVAVGLLTVLFFIPFTWWAVATGVCFGTMEGIGVLAKDPHYPPLTDVIRAFVPIWVSVPVIWALAAGAGAKWIGWPHPVKVALLVGTLGWLNQHFEGTYQR